MIIKIPTQVQNHIKKKKLIKLKRLKKQGFQTIDIPRRGKASIIKQFRLQKKILLNIILV